MSNEGEPSLRKYFEEDVTQPAAQFFDEIAVHEDESHSSDTKMRIDEPMAIQEVIPIQTTESLFSDDIFSDKNSQFVGNTKAFSPKPATSVYSSFGSESAVTMTTAAKQLPDPATFFDNIGTLDLAGSADLITDSSLDFVQQSMDEMEIQPGEDLEGDRRTEAWIPNETTQKVLAEVKAAQPGAVFLEAEYHTSPGIIMEEELPDALQTAARQYLNTAVPSVRERLSQASQDENGLRQLMRAGKLRAAINLTGVLLTACGQGVGRVGMPTRNTPRSLQLWFTRLALMARVKLYSMLERESQAFGELDKPDMFYQFYPDTYGSRRGSMAPFCLRVLLADLPMYVHKPDAAMQRLYALLHSVRQILKNLRHNKSEDGLDNDLAKSDLDESKKVWSSREARILHSIVNCALLQKEYQLAMSILESLSSSTLEPGHARAARAALARVCLQAGHVSAARLYFTQAAEIRRAQSSIPDLRELIDEGLFHTAMGDFNQAYDSFQLAAKLEPTNVVVGNNMAVCLLYLGKLKEAITVLQDVIKADPQRGLTESLLINLCTLYELESSQTQEKKLGLLKLICKYKSDTIPNVAECLKLM